MIRDMKEKGMSNREIARDLDISRNTVSKLLRTPRLTDHRQRKRGSKLDPSRDRIRELISSYLRDDSMISTYMFLNLLSLYLHFQILNMIDGKYSVRDVLLILSRIKMYRMENGEIMSEVPKKAKDLVSDLKIDLDILRKKA